MEKNFKHIYYKDTRLYFTSDTHFGHSKIIEMCNRPFTTVEEMNETMIKNWNDKVSPNDIVFHLGDFIYGGSAVWKDTLERLNGHKILILGNHDMKNFREGYRQYFDEVLMQAEIIVEDRSVYLNHYPFLCYGGVYREDEMKVWQLFGHVHSGPDYENKDGWRLQYLFPTQYDVGVDNNNFTPVSWDEVKEKINKQVKEYRIYTK